MAKIKETTIIIAAMTNISDFNEVSPEELFDNAVRDEIHYAWFTNGESLIEELNTGNLNGFKFRVIHIPEIVLNHYLKFI